MLTDSANFHSLVQNRTFTASLQYSNVLARRTILVIGSTEEHAEVQMPEGQNFKDSGDRFPSGTPALCNFL